jgi:hypothetical protein
MRNLRVLCLHGYHGSAVILRRQMAPLAAAIGPAAELIYVDAPSLAGGHVIPGGRAVTAPIAEFLAGFGRGSGAPSALDGSRSSR